MSFLTVVGCELQKGRMLYRTRGQRPGNVPCVARHHGARFKTGPNWYKHRREWVHTRPRGPVQYEVRLREW